MEEASDVKPAAKSSEQPPQSHAHANIHTQQDASTHTLKQTSHPRLTRTGVVSCSPATPIPASGERVATCIFTAGAAGVIMAEKTEC